MRSDFADSFSQKNKKQICQTIRNYQKKKFQEI